MEYHAGEIDVAIVGAGHAGVEAALVCARLGVTAAIFSLSLDVIANLPCNPSIGGTAKGHLVRELDALGGEMAKAADAVFLQSRMLNRGKGPAVHSLRVQADRTRYHAYMKKALENEKNLLIKQAEIVDIRTDASGAVSAVVTALGAVYRCKAAILCTGTYLGGRIFVGDVSYPSGPDGMHASVPLIDCLNKLGLPLRRFKTGTPARVHRDSIDFSRLEVQYGDEPVEPFSFETRGVPQNTLPCHVAYTNPRTHQIIREKLHGSALYGGNIQGVGPRYCPSIEDKVVRFAGKDRHQVFVEPMGLDTCEMYLQGLSTSLPEDVQNLVYRSVEGFEEIRIMRSAYAIEYDCMDPTELFPTLEVKRVPGLFGAGQFNGTSGYEEAAAQGFVAGVNAAHQVLGREAFVLERSGSYIGTLIDDLVTKGCEDPYRMMTSRSEFRLLLRQDNADARLTPTGRRLGLISDERWERFEKKQEAIQKEQRRLGGISLAPTPELNRYLEHRGTAAIASGARFLELLRRPQLDYAGLAAFDGDAPVLPPDVTGQVEILVKYEGYIKKQLAQAGEVSRLEARELPEDLDYALVRGIRLEAREKLTKIRPRSVGQAARISGVSPADISVLLIWLEQNSRAKGGVKGEEGR